MANKKYKCLKSQHVCGGGCLTFRGQVFKKNNIVTLDNTWAFTKRELKRKNIKPFNEVVGKKDGK